MKTRSAIIALVLSMCLPAALFAANLKLKSGQEIEGAIIEQTDKYIRIDFMGVPLTYFLEDVDTIDGIPAGLPVKEEPKEIAESKPETAEDYFSLGFSSTKKGNTEEAAAFFSKAIELNPRMSEAYYNRGLAAKKQGDLEQAVSDFSKAIEINPKYKEAYNNRAVIYYMKKEFQPASQDIRKAEELGYSVNPKFLELVKKALKEQKK